MQTPRMMRPLVVLAIIAALYPLVVLMDLFSFVIHAHIQLGHWPNFGDPDPKEITAGFQRIRIGLGLIGFPVASTGAVGLALCGRYRQKNFPIWTVVALTAASVAVMFAFLKLDPGGFVNWYWD